jgi:hypothetical protein
MPVIPAECARCTVCHEVKPVSDFHKSKARLSGHGSCCIACANSARNQKRRAIAASKPAKLETLPRPTKPVMPPGFARCKACHQIKRLHFFYRREDGPGYTGRCGACINAAKPVTLKKCGGCDARKPFSEFERLEGGRYEPWCRLCVEVKNRLATRSLMDIETPAPRPAPAYVGALPESRETVGRFLQQHEGQNPARYTGAGVVIRAGLSPEVQSYLSRFTR